MFNGRANRAAQRLAEQALQKQLHTLTILTRKENGKQVFQWGGNNGQWFSPVLDDVQLAHRYPIDFGLKLQQEGLEE